VVEPAPAVVPPPSVGVDKGGGRAPAGPGPKQIVEAPQKCPTVAPARGGRF